MTAHSKQPATHRSLDVIDGPPVFSLIMALFDRRFNREDVEFTLVCPTLGPLNRVLAVIHSVGKEPSSEDKWHIVGVLYQEDYWSLPQYPHRFEGIYDTRTREGSFDVVELLPGSVALLQRKLLVGDQRFKEEDRIGVRSIQWPPLHSLRIT